MTEHENNILFTFVCPAEYVEWYASVHWNAYLKGIQSGILSILRTIKNADLNKLYADYMKDLENTDYVVVQEVEEPDENGYHIFSMRIVNPTRPITTVKNIPEHLEKVQNERDS